LLRRPNVRSFDFSAFDQKKERSMLWTITVILFVLWILGMVSGATLGWWIHVLLVLAVISLIFAVIRRGGGAAV
jgi:fatty acid desaturase